jgi:hypothetical protein
VVPPAPAVDRPDPVARVGTSVVPVPTWRSLLKTAGDVVAAATRPASRRSPAPRQRAAPTGRRLAYAPDLDGRADPGEVVWTWVAYEEDASKGKDRPVLVVGRDGTGLLGLMLSSNAERDGQRDWLGLGAGAWDGEHRPSWVRLDRVLELTEDGIRREGAVLPRDRFDRVATALRAEHGWT